MDLGLNTFQTDCHDKQQIVNHKCSGNSIGGRGAYPTTFPGLLLICLNFREKIG